MTTANLTSSTFTTSLLSTIEGFFYSILSALTADFQQLTAWFGNEIVLLFTSWGSSFSAYGVFIPALMVITIGITLIGTYFVLTFIDAGKDLVGE
ncbi:hypothetical protein [Caldiplasma sukawensis]